MGGGKLTGGMKEEVLSLNLFKQFISKVLLKLRIDHGGEGIILDSHGEDYLTMLGKCLHLSAVRLLMMDLRKKTTQIFIAYSCLNVKRIHHHLVAA